MTITKREIGLLVVGVVLGFLFSGKIDLNTAEIAIDKVVEDCIENTLDTNKGGDEDTTSNIGSNSE